MKYLKKSLFLFFIFFAITGYAYTAHTYHTKSFDIYSVHKSLNQCQNRPVFVYIEGDGLAWKTKFDISNNPTPTNPVSLNLMKKANQPCAIYLARPCQYTKQPCDSKDYTSRRYSYTIIQSYQALLDELKEKYNLSGFTLVGHSGGGVIAALIATQREDIVSFITIASNTDTYFWTNYHKISPLNGSLNPADFAYLLEDTPQYHLIGKKDTNVPIYVFESYISKFKNKNNVHSFIYDTDHIKNWEYFYLKFLKEYDSRH